MKHSIVSRLAGMFALVALLTFALVGAVLYMVLDRELARHEDNELRINLQNLQYSIERTGEMERWGRVQVKMDTLTPADGSVRFWVLSADARYRYGKGLPDVEREMHDVGDRGRLHADDPAHPLRTMSRVIPPFGDRPQVRLIVGVDTRLFEHTLRTFLITYASLSVVASALAMLLGSWIARLGLRPLERLSREAQALRPKTRSHRLAVQELPGELQDLALAFNGALSRLEVAYDQLEGFNADVAHELRTPLANMIGATQVALSRPRDAAQFQDVLQSNLEELERLRSIVNDMLFLARADQGEAATALVQAAVADEVRKTIEFFEFVLDEAGTTVHIEGDLDAQATMERSLFRRAMSNLLQNAIDHSKPGARLAVRIEREGDSIWVTVSNAGEPITEPHLQRLFDRFYRVDAARNDRTGQPHGYGLGLAIVKAVASMHGGGVSAASSAGVTTIGFSVPRAA